MVHFRTFLLLCLGAACTYAAESEAERYQLIGKILPKEAEVSLKTPALVVLEGIRFPFAARTSSDLSGTFKFKNLKPDMYTVVVFIPFTGEHRQTVEVSPGLADSDNRIFVDVNFRPNRNVSASAQVSSSQLSISGKALKEFEKARKKLGQRDSNAAVLHLKKAVDLAPQFTEAWNTLGTLAYKSGDLPLAERYFREALNYDPNYYPSIVNLGGILMAEGKTQESLPLNLAAVRATPEDALAQSQLGLNYYYLKRYEEAERHLKRAISLDPAHFSFPQLALADIYMGKKDYGSAALALEQFIALHPDAKQAAVARRQIEELRPRQRAVTTPNSKLQTSN